MGERRVRIGAIACGRAGDLADVLDLAPVAYDERDDARRGQLASAQYAARALNRVVPGALVRYELPAPRALKFVASTALAGSVCASPRARRYWQTAAIWPLPGLAIDATQS
jgi:hypothetical protein